MYIPVNLSSLQKDTVAVLLCQAFLEISFPKKHLTANIKSIYAGRGNSPSKIFNITITPSQQRCERGFMSRTIGIYVWSSTQSWEFHLL